jgi:hypothetical protein
MDTPPIHDEYYPAMNIPVERAQESNHILSTDIFSLNAPVKSNPASMGSKGDGTDDRESIMTAPLTEYRCLSSGCPCPAHQGLEHKSTLVQKDDTSVLLLSVFYIRPLFFAPGLNLFLISFPAPPLWLLATPAASMKNFPDMGGMIAYTEMALDDLGYPWQCPQLTCIPMSQRPFEKQFQKFLSLLRR